MNGSQNKESSLHHNAMNISISKSDQKIKENYRITSVYKFRKLLQTDKKNLHKNNSWNNTLIGMYSL